MIESLTLDRDFAYTVTSGVISRHKLSALGGVDTMPTPPGATVVQVAVDRQALHARHDDGAVSRLKLGSTAWEPLTVPPGVSDVSTSDRALYLVAAGQIHRRENARGTFSVIAHDFGDIRTLAHDEAYTYALGVDGQIRVRKPGPRGSDWALVLPRLSGVQRVAASLSYVYARTSDGRLHRSHFLGRSGWEPLRSVGGIGEIATPVTHRDVVYFTVGAELRTHELRRWSDIVQADKAYIAADYIDDDYISTAA